jgi:prepilin-type N-terminal cleavage/methylation domain-containing protein
MNLTRNMRVNSGFTLLELMIVTAIIATVIGLSMVMLKQAGDDARTNILMSHYESRLQTTLDDIVMHSIESSSTKMSLYAYDRDGKRHTVIVFPTARDRDDEYIFTGVGGVPSPTPVWQALVVYAYSNGSIYRYMDFTPRVYTNRPYVQNIDNTTITVYDGTKDIYFNLDGTPRNANQTVWKVLDHASSLLAFMPQSDDPPYNQEPPGQGALTTRRYDIYRQPVNLRVEAEVPIEHREGATIVISLGTGVLTRNQN